MKDKFTFSKWAERLYGKKIHGPTVCEKAWSIKHEGHLNKNNIIFTQKMKRLVRNLEKINQNLGYYVLNEQDKWVKVKVEVKDDRSS